MGNTRARRFPACGWCLWLVVLWVVVAPLEPAIASARQPFHAAGLVIDYGDGRVTYGWVPFVEESITGIELLKRSGLSLVAVGFGGLGEGVCSIEGTGCGTGECRSRLCQTGDRESPFWQYLRQDASGTWKPFALGASQSTVRDGDIDGWAWAGTAPELPALSMSDIVSRTGPGATSTPGDTLPAALIVTEGGAAERPAERSWRSLWPAAGMLAGVAGVGAAAIWRSRGARRGQPLRRSPP